jgi:SOS-response transcriptional repressor LexA
VIPMTPVLARQLDAIRPLFVNGVSPSYEEIKVAVGLTSKSGVNRLLHALRARGKLTFEYGVPRSVRLLDEGSDLARFSDAALLAEVERRAL